MAKRNTKVLLGFDDEVINDKHEAQLNFTVNKIGGQPDLPSNIKLEPPKCPLCQVPRPLVVQIYAPLEENPSYHRILYLFACINPNCWSLSDSWLCIRVQTQEKLADCETETVPKATAIATTEWCVDAGDWDDDINANGNEENGNIINNPERVSDEDDESCSFEESVRCGLGNLTVDECNANVGAQGGAVGRLHSPAATAEIEGNEGEVISIDTPTVPQNDLAALLQEVTPLPHDLCQVQRKSGLFQFVPYFMTVWEETPGPSTNISDRHVKELLQEYQMKGDESTNLLSPDSGGGAAGGGPGETALEKYEKSHPAHGDKLFYHFLSKVQSNPGQILRYSRAAEPPLLLQPLPDLPKKCQYCNGELIFEFQLVPTIISKLKLATDAKPCARLEFGTILVFTCRGSCWDSDTAMRTETVVLQSEVY